MPQPPPRPLTLHVSALSNSEYSAYTSSLAEAIAPMPDIDWDDLSIGVREARGWIKGRYGIDGTAVDQILRYFSPNLTPQDTLSAGQFFAALRLVSHAQNGATVGEELVFIQATPERERTPPPNKPRPLSSTTSPTSVPPPPPRPANSSPEIVSISPSLPPRRGPVVVQNPFSRTPQLPSQPPPHFDKEEHVVKPPPSSNPFRRASDPHPSPASPSLAPSASSSPANTRQYATPPLPPRKPVTTLLPPPRHASLSTVRPSPPSKPSILSQSPSYAHPLPTPPIKPPKPPQATSPLIRQSLLAAKGAQTEKEQQELLKKLRKLEVIKKSGASTSGSGEGQGHGSTSTSSGSGSESLNGRRGPALTIPSQARTPSPPTSFYDVAHARIGPAPRSRASSASSSSAEPPRAVGPGTLHSRTHTDPALKPRFILDPASPSSPRRTQSLHHPRTSLAAPPTPPPRRRPESFQVQPSTLLHHTNGNGHVDSSPLSRHLSFTSATLHRAFEGLRPGPGFESARVRAEGRVWPGGYVKGLSGDGERLVGDVEDGFGQDVEESMVERDATKMAVEIGDGWKPLG